MNFVETIPFLLLLLHDLVVERHFPLFLFRICKNINVHEVKQWNKK